MEIEQQYLTEKHYLVCTKGLMPKQLCVDTQHYTFFSSHKAATCADVQKTNVFMCVGSVAFAAGAAVGIACCCVPGPGWVLALVIAAILAIAAAYGYFKCKWAAASRKWLEPTASPTLTIYTNVGKQPALMLSSVMQCPEGGTITAKETLWEAWGNQALTNLGHLVDFAFGFLVGRGAGAMAMEGFAAYGAATTSGVATSTAISTGLRTAGRSFVQTAKTELKQFIPWKGWKSKAWICNALRGLGLLGAYWEQISIWTDDEKKLIDKVEASSIALVLSIFAAKGMTLVCFPAGTKVHTQWGLANIERLEEGVPVLTYNVDTGEKEYKPVVKTSRRMTQRMCVIELTGGQMLEVTPEHRFFCGGEWVPVEELEIGSELKTEKNDYLTIENKTIIFKFVEVFNLEVQDNENYFVTEEGILVHNGYEKPNHGAGKSLKKYGHARNEHGSQRKAQELIDRAKKQPKPGASPQPQGHFSDNVLIEEAFGKIPQPPKPGVYNVEVSKSSKVYFPDGSVQETTNVTVVIKGTDATPIPKTAYPSVVEK